MYVCMYVHRQQKEKIFKKKKDRDGERERGREREGEIMAQVVPKKHGCRICCTFTPINW